MPQSCQPYSFSTPFFAPKSHGTLFFPLVTYFSLSQMQVCTLFSKDGPIEHCVCTLVTFVGREAHLRIFFLLFIAFFTHVALAFQVFVALILYFELLPLTPDHAVVQVPRILFFAD